MLMPASQYFADRPLAMIGCVDRKQVYPPRLSEHQYYNTFSLYPTPDSVTR